MATPVTTVGDIEDYGVALRAVLDAHASDVRSMIGRALAALPERTRRVDFGIHPGQDGEGDFAIWIHLDGPDLVPLNKSIAPYRQLFSVRGPEGWKPGVPRFDRRDPPFEVNDAIVDIVGDWLIALYATIEGPPGTPPAAMFGEDEWGTVPFRELGRGQGT